MKKLIVCLALLAFVGYASAAENVLIGTWEGETNEGWYDFPTAASGDYNPDNTGAWVDNPVLSQPITSTGIGGYEPFSYDWSTDGYVSLRFEMMGASGDNSWGNKLARSVMDDWLDNYIMEFDVYSDGDWAQIVCINMNAQSTGGDYGTLPMWGDWGTPLWSSGDASHVSLSTAAFRGDGWAQATDGWMNIIFQVQGAEGAHLYLDNVQLLVPEPATMALLGLGGLALLRRKR